MRWAEASLLELTVFEKIQVLPPETGLAHFWTGAGFGFLVFWYQSKLGFDFPENPTIEKVRSSCQKMH
jgi:hypothetical protein